jgi:electron transport complex protein RnfB
MPERDSMTRRELVRLGLRTSATVALGGLGAVVAARSGSASTVWQIDPDRCSQCERCSTHCVLSPSAVKCVHAFDVCGYCTLCGGYHRPGARAQDTAAENQLCPTGALVRTWIEDPFFEYTVDEALCIGCSRCVAGCAAFGNGSLYLQVRHDRCLNCNQCSIAEVCPSDAFRRIPREQPYLLRSGGEAAEEPA